MQKPFDDTTIEGRYRRVLERCQSIFWFDLVRMTHDGPDYNQAVKDVADAVREVLREDNVLSRDMDSGEN